MCVCVVRERERARAREQKREREKERKRDGGRKKEKERPCHLNVFIHWLFPRSILIYNRGLGSLYFWCQLLVSSFWFSAVERLYAAGNHLKLKRLLLWTEELCFRLTNAQAEFHEFALQFTLLHLSSGSPETCRDNKQETTAIRGTLLTVHKKKNLSALKSTRTHLTHPPCRHGAKERGCSKTSMTDEFVIAIKYHCGTVEHCWAVTKIHSWWLCIEKAGGAKPGKLFDQGARFFVEDKAAEHNLVNDIQRVLLHTMLICSPVHFWWTTSCSLVTRQQDCPHPSSDSSMLDELNARGH